MPVVREYRGESMQPLHHYLQHVGYADPDEHALELVAHTNNRKVNPVVGLFDPAIREVLEHEP